MIKNLLLKMGAVIATTAMVATTNASIVKANEDTQSTEMKSAKEIVSEMGVGWNLGNTLDSYGDYIESNDPSAYETAWGNPVTTKAMIDKVKEAGFKTVRVPVTWGPHMGDAPSYTVDSAWMNRVEEVVDYAIDDGLYVILNVHHDSEWCIPTYAMEDQATTELEALWSQIATRFENYDDHLIFETLNEPRLLNSAEEWIGGTSEGRQVVNDYNEAALNTIRATGGNNADRAVMIPTYGACGQQSALADYKVFDDPNIIVSLHAYTPYLFAMTQDGTKEWGTDADKAALVNELTYYHNYFEAKGVPVVMGEFGTIDKDNLDARVAHAKTYIETATKLGMPCCWWDNNWLKEGDDNTYRLLNRTTLQWAFPELKDALIDTYNDTIEAMNPSTDDDNDSEDVVTDSDSLALSASMSSWTGGYQISVDIKNNSTEAVNGWTLKIKNDSALTITNYWNVDLAEKDGYIIITPKSWTSSIAAGQSISFGLQGSGVGTTDFDYELTNY